MIDVSPMTHLDFWTNLQPAALSTVFERGFFFLFALLIIFGSLSRILSRSRKDDYLLVKAYRYLGQLLLTMGVLGMLWFFFSFEEIYFFGARFWFLVWLLVSLAWLGWIIRYVKVTVPRMRQMGAAKKDSNKYLPKKKGR